MWIVYTATHLPLELTVCYLSGIGRLTAASTREKEPPSHSRLHTAVSRGIKYLSDTASTRLPHGIKNNRLTAAWKRLPGRLKNTYPGTAVSQHFPNGCLAVNSSISYQAGVTILAMYCLIVCFQENVCEKNIFKKNLGVIFD